MPAVPLSDSQVIIDSAENFRLAEAINSQYLTLDPKLTTEVPEQDSVERHTFLRLSHTVKVEPEGQLLKMKFLKLAQVTQNGTDCFQVESNSGPLRAIIPTEDGFGKL